MNREQGARNKTREEDRSPFTADNYFYMQRGPLLLHRFNRQQ